MDDEMQSGSGNYFLWKKRLIKVQKRKKDDLSWMRQIALEWESNLSLYIILFSVQKKL